jgi:hypothetical protein
MNAEKNKPKAAPKAEPKEQSKSVVFKDQENKKPVGKTGKCNVR